MRWRRLLILDVALAAVIAGGVFQVRKSWDEFEKQHRTEAIQPEKETVRSLPPPAPRAGASEDWTDISVKNPFSFDRNDVAIVAPKQAAAQRPKPVLFGVMSVGNEWIAMMGPGQSNGRGSRPVKIGESLDSWQVVEIQPKSVIVTADNGNRETIIMNDPKEQVARSAERTSTGSTPSPTVIPTAASSTAPANPQSPSTSQSPPQSAPNQPADDILQTPFGPVKRTRP